MPNFNDDIPQMTRGATYAVDIPWSSLARYYVHSITDGHLNVCPDFQRGYVWTPEQKVRYVEFILSGGSTGKNLYTNCPDWDLGGRKDYVLVDGKQRLDAVLAFMNNEFGIFGGHFFREWTGPLRHYASFKWHVNTLQTNDEVLQWYIDLNAGGTVHKPEEIEKVRQLKGKGAYVHPPVEELLSLGGIDRELLREAIAEEKEYAARMDVLRAEADAERAAKPKRKKRG